MPNPGLSPAVLDAVQRRQQGGTPPALNQASPQAAMANPPAQPMAQSDMTQASAPPGQGAATPTMPKFEAQNRKDLITLALIEQLKNDNKLDKEKLKMSAQPAPEPAQASVAPPPVPTNSETPATGGGNPMGGGAFSLSPGFEQPMAKSQMQGDYGSMTGRNFSDPVRTSPGAPSGSRMAPPPKMMPRMAVPRRQQPVRSFNV